MHNIGNCGNIAICMFPYIYSFFFILLLLLVNTKYTRKSSCVNARGIPPTM